VDALAAAAAMGSEFTFRSFVISILYQSPAAIAKKNRPL